MRATPQAEQQRTEHAVPASSSSRPSRHGATLSTWSFVPARASLVCARKKDITSLLQFKVVIQLGRESIKL
jgi:hypothetical protein